ncbi:uncharacterized protein CMU_000400 [Cryptosporidium muris RN66]|uniref:Uncharacterized protein n=1 Tax=Cryptosporidium muris (strain RN66) TaxID=441375 RepID=B6AG29_CRYMR|nr:uncharacterized protein CMU_000400 [Cryptosporidium muris RN66]EEA07170.1 hypothetical protein, conserved [Cryptosporidium muris RN66]|eukprot:XP_002141519.1 hypothetical protein [Cryptosporidium muris RN66]
MLDAVKIWKLLIYLLIYRSLVKCEIPDVSLPGNSRLIQTSYLAAQKLISNSRVKELSDFLSLYCNNRQYYNPYSPQVILSKWELFRSWYKEPSTLLGIIFENLLSGDNITNNKVILPLASNYLYTLIKRELIGFIVLSLAVFLFMVISLIFLLCRHFRDRVISLEESFEGLNKVKYGLIFTTICIFLLCSGYIIANVLTIIRVIKIHDSITSSFCWVAVGIDSLTNGNVNVNITSGKFNVKPSSAITNASIPFLGAFPIQCLLEQITQQEQINKLTNSSLKFIQSAGFGTTLADRFLDLASFFNNRTLFEPGETNWSVPAGLKIPMKMVQFSETLVETNSTVFGTINPQINELIAVLKSGQQSADIKITLQYFVEMKKFTFQALYILDIIRTSNIIIFYVIISLTGSIILSSVFAIIFSIIHTILLLYGSTRYGCFQSSSAIGAIAFFIIILSTCLAFIIFLLSIGGIIGQDYCSWMAKDLFNTAGSNWIKTVKSEISEVIESCIFPVPSYLSEGTNQNSTSLLHNTMLKDQLQTNMRFDHANEYVQSENNQLKSINIDTHKSVPAKTVSNKITNSIKYNWESNETEFINDMVKQLSMSNERLPPLQDTTEHIFNGKSSSHNILSMVTKSIQSGLTEEVTRLVSITWTNIINSQDLAVQCITFINYTDFINYATSYFPNVNTGLLKRQQVPVLILITQSSPNQLLLNKTTIFGFTTYSALSGSKNYNVNSAISSATYPYLLPGMEVFQSIIIPFKLEPLQKENPSNSKDPLIITSTTDLSIINVAEYLATNPYFSEYPLAYFENALWWAKKLAELYKTYIVCPYFSWIDLANSNSSTSVNDHLYQTYSGKPCLFKVYGEYMHSLIQDYFVNPSNQATSEIDHYGNLLTAQLADILGSVTALQNAGQSAYDCGQISIDFTNGITTMCGLVSELRTILIDILTTVTFTGYLVSIFILIIWLIAIRYETRIADSILERTYSSTITEDKITDKLSMNNQEVNTTCNNPVDQPLEQTNFNPIEDVSNSLEKVQRKSDRSI